MAKGKEARRIWVALRQRETKSKEGNPATYLKRPAATLALRRNQKGRRLVRAARRAELLEAAIAVMRERGVAGARVADVTFQAGVAKGTFYVHFDSWDDLVLAARDQLSAELAQGMMLRAKNVGDSSWVEFLVNEAVSFVDTMVAMGPLRRVVLHGPTDTTSTSTPIVNSVRELIKSGVSNGAFAIDDPSIAGTLMFSAWCGATEAVIANGQKNRHRGALRQMMRGWLSRQEPAER